MEREETGQPGAMQRGILQFYRPPRGSATTRAGAMLIVMTPAAGKEPRHELELAALRALCQPAGEDSLLSVGLEILAGYQFVVPAHQVLFEALQAIHSVHPRRIREHLPVLLNNRGFPDFDLENFYQPPALSREQAIELLRWLAAIKPSEAPGRFSP